MEIIRKELDPLSPFMFAIIGEYLSALVRKAIETRSLSAFSIEGLCNMSILQFIDDTLLIGYRDRDQVWVLKVILRCFEMVSGLGVNFH